LPGPHPGRPGVAPAAPFPSSPVTPSSPHSSPEARNRPALTVLFGQPDHLSTSFQTTQLARALGAHARVRELRVTASRRGGWRRSLRRIWANYLRPWAPQPPCDYLLYANDGCADLRRWRGRRLLYWYDAPADWSREPPRRWIDRLRCRNVVVADHVFAVSAAQVGLARCLRPNREDSVHYLPVGVDCSVFDPKRARPDRVREKYGLPAGPIVGYLGYLASWEGRFAGEPLAAVAPRLAALGTAHFLVVGFGPALETFRERVRALGVAERFTFTGYVPDDWLPDCLAAMDVCVDTLEPGFHSEARSETKLKQYMAMGRACVATDIGENRTDLDHGRCGLLVPPGDDGLLDGLRILCADPARRAELGAAARRRAAQDYDWSHLAARLASEAGFAPASDPRP
jgi:glycosyltransferase involved in cell wall biosynthesis